MVLLCSIRWHVHDERFTMAAALGVGLAGAAAIEQGLTCTSNVDRRIGAACRPPNVHCMPGPVQVHSSEVSPIDHA